MRGKLRVLGNVPTQCKREAWGRGHIRKGRAKWFWEGCSWVLPQGEKYSFSALSCLKEHPYPLLVPAACLPEPARWWRAPAAAWGAALWDLGSSKREGAV